MGVSHAAWPARECLSGVGQAGLAPDLVVSVVRGRDQCARLTPAPDSDVARALVTGTYLAGELRRYWGYAAALSAGSLQGPAHPDVTGVAARLTTDSPCSTLALPCEPGARLTDVLKSEVSRCS